MRWITAHNEYLEFFESNQLLRTPYFFVPVLESNDGFALGITVSKKIGKAVVRNLLRRRIKAFIRQYRDSFPENIKINLIAKSGLGELSWQSMCKELELVFQKLSQETSSSK